MKSLTQKIKKLA